MVAARVSAALCCTSYLVATAVFLATVAVADQALPPFWLALIADLAATLAIFAGSLISGNSCVYDPYWCGKRGVSSRRGGL